MWLLYVFIVLTIIVFVLGMIAPQDYQVQRSTTIKLPLSKVFDYLKYLKNQDDWSPWQRRDPNMKKEFKGIDGQPGFVSAWEGNKDVGAGEQELTNLVDNKRIESELRFLKPFKSTSDAFIEVEPGDDDSTRVTWGFSGKNNFPMNIIMLFSSMDKMVGKDFEEGLNNLKERLEA
ncbi:MAG: SRPBCC family protein [Saprospiraceae bacterium]|nr:SRPBCC family protein [Saprospiraceae bacterium]